MKTAKIQQSVGRHWKVISNQPKMRFTDCICSVHVMKDPMRMWISGLTDQDYFEAMTDSLLRDRVVLGMKDKATRAWMFREKVKKSI